jgi:hypothetical protein
MTREEKVLEALRVKQFKNQDSSVLIININKDHPDFHEVKLVVNHVLAEAVKMICVEDGSDAILVVEEDK